MNSAVYIRRLNENDLEVFFQLRLEALQNSPTSFLMSYEEEKSLGATPYKDLLKETNKSDFIFGAFMNHTIIGFIAGYQGQKANIKHKCTLWGTYVKLEYRKHQIGTLLMKAVIAHVKGNLNSKVLYLSVESTNIAAQRLYEACGFKIWGTEPHALSVEGKPYALHHMSLLLKN